jgi:PadR family transcriptional regulator, regulatory protein PadR
MTRVELLKGTLNMLILRSLELEARHATAIAARIERVTAGTFQVKPGSLFPALQRLEHDGFVQGEWSTSGGRRVRSYALTASGRLQLDREISQWGRIVLAVTQALGDEN